MESNPPLASAVSADRPLPESDSDSLSLLSEERGPGHSSTSDSSVPETPEHGLDENDDADPIVVCGFAVRFPGDASSSEAFWKMMMEKRCASGEFPRERVNIDGFYSEKYNASNTLPLRGGHFIDEDTARFDADFFSISPNEAASLDPMQRWLLEVAYSALENAGIPMESVAGTLTGVFAGAFGIDYLIQLCRDVEDPPSYAALGLGISMLANRLSWFFDLRGPSIGMDSACSSTAMALDHACDSLKKGACNMAMIAGSNLAVAPETYTWLSNINFLSPNSRCYSFDHRGNGYARGEGIGVVILKRLSDALRDGNTIRAVIRATGSNEDGKTPSITQPSREAQEELIHETYRKAGLSMAYTRFFESHGTGTAVGDPKEAQAIGTSFRKYRSTDDRLYVGALKSNIGHLEGCAALAGLVKAVMVLEKGVIPPNTNFEKLNPKIDSRFLKLEFPEQPRPWPTSGLRRASVNSFGYGGSNSHIVVDDAYNYMRLRGIHGKHRTRTAPPPMSGFLEAMPTHESLRDDEDRPVPGKKPPKLILLSSSDKSGIGRIAGSLQDRHGRLRDGSTSNEPLDDLAYTLDSQRSRLTWKSFALLRSSRELDSLSSQMSTPAKETAEALRVGFVFSGQGAQWFGMGRELLNYSSFEREVERSGDYLKTLGCAWSPMDEFLRPQAESNVDRAEYSQALCTIVQVAIVNLLRRFGVMPSAVVGHSSGEIAAAYAAGYLDQESAWKVAYFRGICSAQLAEPKGQDIQKSVCGSMISVGLSEIEAQTKLAPLHTEAQSFGISIACINSPSNVTVSGEERLIDQLKVKLDEEDVFARKLRVPLAYHSGQMEAMASEYAAFLGSLSSGESFQTPVPILSSVTGERLPAESFVDGNYWVRNMISPVRFSQAIAAMCTPAPAQITKKIDMSHLSIPVVDHILEIGPHAALQGPIRDVLATCPGRTKRPAVTYSSALKRGQDAAQTLLSSVGALFCKGMPVNLRIVNEPETDGDQLPIRNLLTNLPEYPFDHSRRYWHESRLSRNYTLRSEPPSEFVGVTTKGSKMQWRHFLRRAESSWIDHHVVSGRVVYPAAGMMVMAIEAAKQVVARTPELTAIAYSLSDVVFENPIDLSSHDGTEVQTSLVAATQTVEKFRTFDFNVESFGQDDEPRTNCRGTVSVELMATSDDHQWEETLADEQRTQMAQEVIQQISGCSELVENRHMYSFLEHIGYGYGPSFQRATEQRHSKQTKRAAANLSQFPSKDQSHVVHPATLDSIVQLCFTCLSSGGTDAMALGIPSRVGSLWISATGLSGLEESAIQGCVSLVESTSRGHRYNGAIVQGSGVAELKLSYDDFEFTDITTAIDPKSLHWSESSDQEQYCMKVATKVAIEKLTSDEKVDLLMSMHPDALDVSQLHRDLEILSILSLENMVQDVDPGCLKDREDWVKRYWSWAEHHLSRFRQEPGWEDAESEFGRARAALPELRERLSKNEGICAAYTAVSTNLRQMIEGEIAPLELLMPSGLLDGFYAEGNTYRSPRLASAYISLMAHQRPGMRMLEVGGGTASTTKILIPQLSDGGSGPGALRCAQYDFTDISSGFLENARNYFQEFQPKMTFGTLNIENDPVSQGYEAGAYDVILADNVLHATLDLVQTMKNVRKLLKPGGKVFMHEWFRADGWSTGFIFGLLSGWWLGADTGRDMSPNVSVQDWDRILREAGFTGVDEVLRDFDEDGSYDQAYLVTTAVEVTGESLGPLEKPGITVFTTGEVSEAQNALYEASKTILEPEFGPVEFVQSFDEATRSTDRLVVSLADYGISTAILSDINERAWKNLQSLFENSRSILWVSCGGGNAPHPDQGMVTGLARTLRLEHYDLQLVTLALESGISGVKTSAVHLAHAIKELAEVKPYENYEQDYVEIDGQLHSSRLVEAGSTTVAVNDKMAFTRIISRPLGQSSFQVSSSQDDVRFEETDLSVDNLESGEVMIEVGAMSLRSSETVESLGWTRQGEVSPAIYGDFCVGVVVAAGASATTALEPGTSVLAVWRKAPRSHIRVDWQCVAALDPSMSLPDTCRMASACTTAYHAIYEVVGPRPHQTILVHDITSPDGRAVASLLMADDTQSLWGTVASKEDAVLAADELGLSQERILPMSWFHGCAPLTSRWKQKFDLIVEPYADSHGSALSAKCLRPGGRYVALQKSKAETTHIAYKLPENAVLLNVKEGFGLPSGAALRHAAAEAAKCGANGINARSDSATVFKASELDQALSRIRSLGDKETAVMSFDKSDTIDVKTEVKPDMILKQDVTYVIVGLGGVGRGIARWMAQRGARHLLLLSRSSTSKPETQDLVSELSGLDVQVNAPSCDVTSKATLRSVLDRYGHIMPRVAGCVQTSMLMTEKIFLQMSHEDWTRTVAPKTHGSWNLHTELPTGLDFFVLLSSVMGILGSGSLSAYNAGNTYQDALARYRMAMGERAVCLDLGAILDVGYLSDALDQGQQVVALGSKMFVRGGLRDILGLMDIYCDTSSPVYRNSTTEDAQVVVGLRPPGQWKHLEDVPFTMTQPFWGHMHYVAPIKGTEENDNATKKKRINVSERLASSESLPVAAEVVSEALSTRIGELLGMPEEGIETQFPMESYGLDSLSAIHIRNWVGTVFDVDMPVFEILGGTTFTEAGVSIARQVLARRESST